MNTSPQRLVLAYSGGLDTSVMLHWLVEQGYDVVAYCADVGQGPELDTITRRASAAGASDVIIDDLRDEFAREAIVPAMWGQARYEQHYLLGTALARPVIAKGQVACAHRIGAATVAHGATGKGNDQIRFELAYRALAPELQIVAPWRTRNFEGRADLLAYAQQHGLEVPVSLERPYSSDRNLMHVSYEGGVLEDPWNAPPADMFELTVDPEQAPSQPREVVLTFDSGFPIALDGERSSLVDLVQMLNDLAGSYGIGRLDIVENRVIGLKSRGVYETPGVTVLSESPDQFLVRFSRSIHVDARLLPYDLAASRAWANELRHCGVLTVEEHEHIDRGLLRLGELHSPADAAAADVEDIHTWIELNLVDLVGEPARRLHTGRSRNDQVMTAMRMWMRDACDQLTARVGDVARTMIGLAKRSEGCIIPAYTHMQRAQPMLLGHWCMSWVDGLERDVERLTQARQRIDVLPLGSGACVGTSVPVDRERIAAALEFGTVSTNSIDAVSDRDSCIDLASACAQILTRLSRLAEDLLLYAGPEYGFLSVADGVTTGSSLLPHKRNLDSMELVRGKAGRVFGSLQSLLVMSKGVPTAYARDLQEDKPSLFDAVDTTGDCLTMTALVVAGAQPCAERMRLATEHGFLEAMELADHLVESGIPFRDAHQQAGRLVRVAEAAGIELRDLSLDAIHEHAPQARHDIHDDLTIEASLARRDILGGTAPHRVKRAIEYASVRWSESSTTVKESG